MKRNRMKRRKFHKPEIVADIDKQKVLDSSVYFPFGKYKNQQVKSICNSDQNYCLWFAHNVVTNSIAVGRVKDVIIQQLMPEPVLRFDPAACSYDSEAYADVHGSDYNWDEDLADVYSFALHDGGGCPFSI